MVLVALKFLLLYFKFMEYLLSLLASSLGPFGDHGGGDEGYEKMRDMFPRYSR